MGTYAEIIEEATDYVLCAVDVNAPFDIGSVAKDVLSAIRSAFEGAKRWSGYRPELPDRLPLSAIVEIVACFYEVTYTHLVNGFGEICGFSLHARPYGSNNGCAVLDDEDIRKLLHEIESDMPSDREYDVMVLLRAWAVTLAEREGDD